MAKQGAQFGNTNATKGSRFRDALHKELTNYANDTIKRKTALSHVVKSLIDKALDGDMPAIKEIADRTDGKPTQAITGPQGEAISLVERVIVVQAIQQPGEVIEGEIVQEQVTDQQAQE